MLLVSCTTTKTIYVPVEHTNTEYIHNIDSIYIKDSIYIQEKVSNDTIFITKYKERIKEIIRQDTLIVRDSIPYIQEVEKIVITNKLALWQKILICIGALYSIILIIKLRANSI